MYDSFMIGCMVLFCIGYTLNAILYILLLLSLFCFYCSCIGVFAVPEMRITGQLTRCLPADALNNKSEICIIYVGRYIYIYISEYKYI